MSHHHTYAAWAADTRFERCVGCGTMRRADQPQPPEQQVLLDASSPSARAVHCKRERYDVYIGRPSKWGNPFAIGRDGTRAEVIAKYRAYIQTRPDLLAALPELRGKVLGCWCAPQACHGDVLLALANAPADTIVDEVDASDETDADGWAQVTGQFQALGWDVRVTRVTRSREREE